MSSESLGFIPTFYPKIQAQLLQLAFDTPSFLSTSISAILHVPAWLTPMTEKLPEGTLGSPLQGVTTLLVVFEGPVLGPQKDQGPDRTGLI